MKKEITKIKKYLQKHKNVIFAYIFGSMAKKTERADSDIDLAVFLEGKKGFLKLKMQIYDDIINDLEVSNIDLVLLNEENLPLSYRVLRDGTLIVDKNPHKRHIYESLALRKYFDFLYIENAILKRRFKLGR